MNRVVRSVMVVVLLGIAVVLYRGAPPRPKLILAKPVPGLQRGDGPNLLASVQDFTNPAWIHGGVTLAPNTAISPDGTKDAARMTETEGGDFHRVVHLVSGVKVAGDYTLSVFVKPAERHTLEFEMTEAQGHYGVTLFDLAKKQVVAEAGDIEDAGMQELPGGWFRCWAVMKYTSTSPAFNITILADSLAVEYTGSDGQGLFIWGPQFEAASEIRGYSIK